MPITGADMAYEKKDNTVPITLKGPDKRNVLSVELMQTLKEAWELKAQRNLALTIDHPCTKIYEGVL